MTPHLLFYTTSACHLCELADALLLDYAARVGPLIIDDIDVASSDQLIAEYGTRIPVLKRRDNGAELGWPFDSAALIAFVASSKPAREGDH